MVLESRGTETFVFICFIFASGLKAWQAVTSARPINRKSFFSDFLIASFQICSVWLIHWVNFLTEYHYALRPAHYPWNGQKATSPSPQSSQSEAVLNQHNRFANFCWCVTRICAARKCGWHKSAWGNFWLRLWGRRSGRSRRCGSLKSRFFSQTHFWMSRKNFCHHCFCMILEISQDTFALWLI